MIELNKTKMCTNFLNKSINATEFINKQDMNVISKNHTIENYCALFVSSEKVINKNMTFKNFHFDMC